ncbi:MAG: trypsin-like peptidase domain-containing protein [Clostridia bacterium]|nr:trypsin-like peptidase domain-containing protein [Clostridia bacterium]
MKRLTAILMALLIALCPCVQAEEDFGGEGMIVFPDGTQADSFLSGANPENHDPFAPEILEKTIFPPDDRVKVKKPKEYPYSAIALIDVQGSCGCNWYCTGAMVSEEALLTCAHTLVCYKHGKWAKKATFCFGYKSRKNYLYRYKSKWTAWVGSTFQNGYAEGSADDWALVRFEKKVGKKTGWFGMRWATDDELSGAHVCMAGFGGEDTLRYCWGTINHVWEKEIGCDIDTLPGNSGSPVFDENYYIVALFTMLGDEYSICRRLTGEIHQKMTENGLF